MHLSSCASPLFGLLKIAQQESGGQPRLSVQQDVLHGQENVSAEVRSRQGAVGLQLDTGARKIRGEIRDLQDEARATSSTRVALRMSSCPLSRGKNKLEPLWELHNTTQRPALASGTVAQRSL